METVSSVGRDTATNQMQTPMPRNSAVSLCSEFCFTCQDYRVAVGTTSEGMRALEKSHLLLHQHSSSPSAPVTCGWWAIRSSIRLSCKFLCWLPSALLFDGSITSHQAMALVTHTSWSLDLSEPTTQVKGLPDIITLDLRTGFAESEIKIVDI